MRLQDIGDARLEIQEIRTGTADEAATPSGDIDELRRTARRSRLRERAWAAAFVAAAVLAASVSVLYLRRAAPHPRAAHFVLDTPKGPSLPEGAPAGRPLAGTEGASLPFWSPDGDSLAFFTEGELRRLNLATGTVQRLCSLPQPGPRGGTWGHDGTLLFSTGGARARIYAVPAGGGEVQPLTTLDAARGEVGHYWPQLLPDGRHFLFLVGAGDKTGFFMASVDRPEDRRKVRPGSPRILYAAPGDLLFVLDGTLMAQPFDAARAELTGEPVAVTQHVAVYTRWRALNWGWFSVSPSGTLAYLEEQAGRGLELTWFDRKGAKVGTVGKPGHYGQIALSPDEKRVAVEISEEGGESDIWTIDVARGVATRQTFDPAADFKPVWSPDSRELAFSSLRDGPPHLYRKALQGDAPASPLGQGLSMVSAECWSGPAKAIVYLAEAEKTHAFGVLPSDGGAKPETILKKSFRIDEPRISPDGRWLAYASQESSRWEVYVAPFRREGERVQVSTEGGGQPRWRGDGKELSYVSPDGQLMAVDVRATGDRIDVGLPVALFSGVIADPLTDHYSATADGQRFLVPVPVGQESRRRIHVVTNWTSLLK